MGSGSQVLNKVRLSGSKANCTLFLLSTPI